MGKKEHRSCAAKGSRGPDRLRRNLHKQEAPRQAETTATANTIAEAKCAGQPKNAHGLLCLPCPLPP